MEEVYEMEMNKAVAVMAAAVEAKKADTTVPEAQEDKPVKPTEQRTKKGYKILEFVRNFGSRGSQKEVMAADENQDPEGDKRANRGAAAKASADVKGIKGDFKAAALRFKTKGPAWGQVSGGDAKKQKPSPIKEVLKQKSQ